MIGSNLLPSLSSISILIEIALHLYINFGKFDIFMTSDSYFRTSNTFAITQILFYVYQ